MGQRGVVCPLALVPKRVWRWLSLVKETLYSKPFPARIVQLAKGTDKTRWPHHEREALSRGGAIYPEVLAWWHVGHGEADVSRPGCLCAQGFQLTLKLFYKVLLGHWARALGNPGSAGVTQAWLHAHHKLVFSEPGNRLSTHAFLQCRQDLVHEPIGHMQVQERTDMSPQTQSSQSHCSLPHTSWPPISRG